MSCANQHKVPCKECPWRRKAMPMFLNGHTAEEWAALAHSDDVILCHVTNETEDVDTEPQCAGAAIYRANLCKSSRDPNVLRLPADRDSVFGFRNEFLEHHTTENLKKLAKSVVEKNKNVK